MPVKLFKLLDKGLDLLINLLESLSVATILAGMGAGFLLGGFILGWYNDQITIPAGGYLTPILENSLGNPGCKLFSYMSLTISAPEITCNNTRPGLMEILRAIPRLSFGNLALVFGMLGSLTIFRPLRFLRIPIGTASLLLGITFIAKLTCFHSNLLEPLVDINDQHMKLLFFSTVNLPPNNLAFEPSFIPGFKTDYLLDRIDSTFYFLSWGWYLTMAGGVLLVSTGLPVGIEKSKYVPLSVILRRMGMVLFFLFLYSLGLFLPCMLAEYEQIKGDNYLAQGNYEQALIKYFSAQRLNNQLFYHQVFRENLGEVYYKLNRADTPEYYIYRGTLLSKEGKTLETLATYQQALRMSPDDPVIKKYLVSLYIQQGLDYFNAGSNEYSAIQSWKAALEIDPRQLQAHFYMGKAYFDMGNYEQSIVENQTFIAKTTNSILKANAYSNIGDCYVKMEKPKEARVAYLLSRSLDRVLNNRMTDSLAGGI
jgi:tetratricopeptide (TPR) repeat protein